MSENKEKYFYGVGRRKRSTARAKFFPSDKAITINVNGKEVRNYFADYYARLLENMLSLVGIKEGRFDLFINGGGIKGQAEAARLAMAKALVVQNEGYKPVLRMNGFLTTDIRKVLPKRPGLRKARKREQWSKR